MLILTLLLLVGAVTPALADHYLPRHRVLLLNSYHSGYVWSDAVETAIRTELARADNTLELLVEHLDSKHFDTRQLFPELEKFFIAKYRQRQPDVLMVADDDALQFVLSRRERLFPGVPVVFCGINNFTDGLITGQPRITGVAENADIAGTIGLILRLQPKVGHIAFISDSGESGKINRQRFQEAATHYRDRVAFVELSDLTLTELRAALSQLPANAAILHTTMFRDRNGTTLSPEGSIALLTETSALPFYGMWEHGIGDEGVGGVITSATLQGEAAAAMALRILRGEAPENIPVLRSAPTRTMFNYPALRRYHIDEAALPEGSVVRNRPISFYREHAELIWTVGISFALLAGLVVALLVNILKRRQAMMLLRTRKNQLQQVVDSMPIGVCLADQRGRIFMANSASKQIWGGGKRVGIDEYHIFKGWWAESGRPLAAGDWGMARAVRAGETSLDELIDIEAFDGKRKTISHSAMPLRDIGGGIIGGLVVIQDVTERKQAEFERQSLITQLEQRNAELEQFTYSVSHDLKTPLVTISGFVGQLRDDLQQGNHDCVDIDLDFIESSAVQMSTLLDNLLQLARSGRVIGDPRPVSLVKTARLAIELAEGVLEQGTARVDFADDLPMVSGDADRLLEVFQNLIENAAKFSRDQQPPRIEIGGKVADQQVLCWVRDNGVGIPPQYLEKIFGLFERLDRGEEGTGIGLALARRIVEKHGGRIWAESAGEDQGSTFYFTLPLP